MTGFNQEEWGATALGLSGFFLGMAVLVLGMLPFWVILIPLALAFGTVMVLTAAFYQMMTYWSR